jgi:hypothetical protein
MVFFVFLAVPLASGCKLFDPNSKFNVNRGELHDENDLPGKIGRGDQEVEKSPDGLGKWLYSPKARQISHNLGTED